MIPTYNGLPVFGVACSIDMVPNANAAQVAAFFGVQGVQSMDGGGRGRVFEVRGLMYGSTPLDVQLMQQQLEQFADGTARILVDTTGGVWPNVVYRREFQWELKYAWSGTLNAWCRPYRTVLHGLT